MERQASGPVIVGTPADEPDTDQFATQVIDTRQLAAELIEAELAGFTPSAAPEVTAPDDDETGVIPVVDAADDDETADETADEAADEADDVPDEVPDEDELEATAKLQLSELTALMADDDDAAPDSEPESELPEPELIDPGTDVAEPRVEATVGERDPAQLFVARLRSSATDFASAAGADSAVVREAVPPARHRRARCRLVLRFADGDVADVTLLGPAGAPGRPSRHGFDRQILRWLGAGLVEDDAWLVDDPDAPDGVAVDLTAWAAAA